MSQAPAPTYAQPPATQDPWAIKTPLGRAIGLSVLSFGLWTFWWFYDTRDKVNKELGKDENALLYTLGLLVPILQFFIIYWLWRDISLLRGRVGLEPFDPTLYIVLDILLRFTFAIGTAVLYAVVLNKTNEYWDRRSGGLAGDTPVRGAQLWLTIIGALFWLLFVVVIVIVIIAAAASSSN